MEQDYKSISPINRPIKKVKGVSLKTIFDHKKRILRTLAYIEDYYDRTLFIKELARVACISEYHFLRSFKSYIGVTVSQYIRGVRLTKAAELLKQSDISILDLVLSVGYESGEAFSKVFKRSFGISPTGFRKQFRCIPPKHPKMIPKATLLIPCLPDDKNNGDKRKLGMEAYSEMSRLSNRDPVNDPFSPWISVFPHFHKTTQGEQRTGTGLRVPFGRIMYAVHHCENSQPFQIVDSGSCRVLSYGESLMAFKKAYDVLPDFFHHGLQHLPQLPVRMRSILLGPR